MADAASQSSRSRTVPVGWGSSFASKHGSGSSSAAADNTPGKFDYYQLTLSWAPEFCATQGSNRTSSECDPKRHYGLVVHGLWPQNDNGSWPHNCTSAQPVSNEIVREMLPIMPARGLIQHEWATHGTCSGLSTQDYFSHVQQLLRAGQDDRHNCSSRSRNRRLVRARSSRASRGEQRHRGASKSHARTANWWRSTPASARTSNTAPVASRPPSAMPQVKVPTRTKPPRNAQSSSADWSCGENVHLGTLPEAKARFSKIPGPEFEKDPEIVTRRRDGTAVFAAIKEYQRHTRPRAPRLNEVLPRPRSSI